MNKHLEPELPVNGNILVSPEEVLDQHTNPVSGRTVLATMLCYCAHEEFENTKYSQGGVYVKVEPQTPANPFCSLGTRTAQDGPARFATLAPGPPRTVQPDVRGSFAGTFRPDASGPSRGEQTAVRSTSTKT